mmetsp:Transcript_8141/g.9779  ORF Transcript_8141/g.9779 Transcript_8141/m.9779 type:complete len:146 (-) Transcript_8141:1966-2403(-)
MHHKWRYKEANRNCRESGFWRKGGSELCSLYIVVECGVGEEMCAYTLSLQLFEYTKNSRRIGNEVTQLPMFVPRDQDYVDVIVSKSDVKQLYFPVRPFEYDDMLIFVNKTASIGKGANLKLVYDIMPDSSAGYTTWYQIDDASRF